MHIQRWLRFPNQLQRRRFLLLHVQGVHDVYCEVTNLCELPLPNVAALLPSQVVADAVLVRDGAQTTTICHLATCSSNWSESTATGYGAQFVVGDTYTCWYNPDDPSEAKLSDEVATPVIAFVCYPMFLLFACVPACAMRKTMKDLCRG